MKRLSWTLDKIFIDFYKWKWDKKDEKAKQTNQRSRKRIRMLQCYGC